METGLFPGDAVPTTRLSSGASLTILSLPPMLVIVTTGAMVLTVKVKGADVPVLPALSV